MTHSGAVATAQGHRPNGEKCYIRVVCAFGVGVLVVVGNGHEADGLVEALAALQRHLQQTEPKAICSSQRAVFPMLCCSGWHETKRLPMAQTDQQSDSLHMRCTLA